MSMNMITAIVPRNYGEVMTKAAVDAGATGGTILMGRGTASNAFLDLLGFGETSKDIVIVLVDSLIKEKVYSRMFNATGGKKPGFGVMFSTAVESFIRMGKVENEEKAMNESTHKLITVIVNKGFAGDAMAAARKAGANGGTILNARGTAREGEEKFFGMEIVPEKEMLLIVCPEEKSEEIVEAVKNLDCLKQPGTGITYTMPASDFQVLGVK